MSAALIVSRLRLTALASILGFEPILPAFRGLMKPFMVSDDSLGEKNSSLSVTAELLESPGGACLRAVTDSWLGLLASPDVDICT